jgi:hypothetical protein
MEMFRGIMYALIGTAVIVMLCTIAGELAYWFFK